MKGKHMYKKLGKALLFLLTLALLLAATASSALAACAVSLTPSDTAASGSSLVMEVTVSGDTVYGAELEVTFDSSAFILTAIDLPYAAGASDLAWQYASTVAQANSSGSFALSTLSRDDFQEGDTVVSLIFAAKEGATGASEFGFALSNVANANYGTEQAATATASVNLYQITFDGNGGTVDGAATGSLSAVQGGVITLPTPARAGYVCRGWSDGASVYAPGDSYTVTANTALTAQWAVNADIVLADFAYAATGCQMLAVKLDDACSGLPALTLNGAAYTFFSTTDRNYLRLVDSAASSGVVYVALIPGTVRAEDVVLGLALDTEARLTAIDRRGDVTSADGSDAQDGTIGTADLGLLTDLLKDPNAYSIGAIGVKARLSCDLNTTDGATNFGSIDDVAAMINAMTN